ncbi:MAG TPA: AI-2E family transporter, partial [Nitrospirales bacterium]|nr:AI-2E family transporter [Nitrospirales bacterium]
PYASIVTWPLAVLLKYLEASGGDWMSIVLWPSLVYVLVGGFEGWVLTPLVQSQTNEMSAAAVLIALFIGGELGGVFGMLLAVPVWSCIRTLWDMYVLPGLIDQADRP